MVDGEDTLVAQAHCRRNAAVGARPTRRADLGACLTLVQLPGRESWPLHIWFS